MDVQNKNVVDRTSSARPPFGAYFWDKVFPSIAPVLLTIVLASLLIPVFQDWSYARKEAAYERRASLEGIIEDSYRYYSRLHILESTRFQIVKAADEIDSRAELRALNPDDNDIIEATEKEKLPVSEVSTNDPSREASEDDPDLLLLKTKFVDQDDWKNEAGEDFFAGLLYAEYVFREDIEIINAINLFREWYDGTHGQFSATEFSEKRRELVLGISPHVQK